MTEYEQLQLVADYKDMFLRSETGKRILKDLENFSGFSKCPYRPGSFDGTAYVCGKQEIVRRIHKMINDENEPRQTKAIGENG